MLDPAEVEHVTADVVAIDTAVTHGERRRSAHAPYDRLVVALGSRVVRPDIPGLSEFGFDVDTYDGAVRLQRHLTARCPDSKPEIPPSASTAVVVGAGLTGIETACELPTMLSDALGAGVTPRVILVDRNPHVGSDMGESARPVIEEALAAQQR